MKLKFEDARASKIVPVCSRFRDGDRYPKHGDRTTQKVFLHGTKPEQREIFVYNGDVLLGRIIHVEPTKVETSPWKRTGSGPWALQPNSKYGFVSPNHAERFCETILQAKKECGEYFAAELKSDQERERNKISRIPLKALPFGSGDEFFPTPTALAGRMIGKINWKDVKTVLEPSAGKGDIISAMIDCSKAWQSMLYDQYRGSISDMVDCIEIDQNLQALLKGLGYRVVADDFLTFHTYKKYDAIIMNPPFSNGDAHLLKAIELQEQAGGQICCLLNAETVRNPYTRRRQELLSKLKEYGAEYDFVKNGFRKAERTSSVETVIITLTVPEPESRSNIVEELKKAPRYSGEYSPTALMEKGDVVRELIQLYNFEADAIVRLLREYQGLLPYLEPGPYDTAIVRLSVGRVNDTTKITSETINSALESLREVFWHKLLHDPDPRLESMIGKMTEKMRQDYDGKIHEMRDRDFSEYNIRALLLDIQSQLCQGLEDEIMRQFREMTSHALYDGCQNVHYYNGWRTNHAAKVNMKVILPFYGAFGSYSWNKSDKLDKVSVIHYLSDLLKVLDFLDRGETSYRPSLSGEIDRANIGDGRRKVFTAYFEASFFKKGTCHIKFHEEARRVVDRLNIFAATHQKDGQNWLPPYFGKVSYDAMDDEGKAVIDSFYGDIEDPEKRHAEYEKVCQNPNYYLTSIDASSLPLLNAGAAEES